MVLAEGHRWQCNTAHLLCWITKATDTQSECVILLALPRQ